MRRHRVTDGERGLLVKRPKKERYKVGYTMLFASALFVYGIVYIITKRNFPFWHNLLTVLVGVSSSLVLGRMGLEEIAEQTYLINKSGITNIRYGKQQKHFRWESFAVIEKHKVIREYGMGADEYEAVICSTHPIEIKIQPNGVRYLLYNDHRKKENREAVVELVLEKDQYAEFLSYIPEKIKGSGIVKI